MQTTSKQHKEHSHVQVLYSPIQFTFAPNTLVLSQFTYENNEINVTIKNSQIALQKNEIVKAHHLAITVEVFTVITKPKNVGYHGQLNSSSLHKQTRKNPLGGNVHSPVEDHDLVSSLPDNLKNQTHSRVSECDGRISVQVEPSPVNRIENFNYLNVAFISYKLTMWD